MNNFFEIVISALFIGYVSSQNCSLRDPKDLNKQTLLNGIQLLHNERFVITANGYTYIVTFCTPASKTLQNNANILRTKVPERDNETTILGRFNNTDIIGRDEWKILTFADGDVIHENGSCNGTKWKSMVILTCDLDNSALELLDPLNAGCVSIFLLKTNVVCHVPSQNPFTILLLILVTAFMCYFIIGMAYKRFVTGAKGLEQIPNYNFWSDPGSWTQNLIGKTERRNEPWTQNSSSDAADEPLLHP